MIKGTFFAYPPFLKNNLFDISGKIFNEDNHLYCFYLLKKVFREKGVDLATQDINNPAQSKFVIFLEMPKIKNILSEKNNYLLIYESPLIKPSNWVLENHKHFKKIFTWDDKLIDNKKYFKINYVHGIPKDLNFYLDKKKKLCTMIAGHKLKSHPLELYTERIKAIRWFEKNHPEDFDLYGTGWDKYYFHGNFLGINLLRLNRLKFLTKLLKPNYSSYKGVVKSKKETYKNYKFAICYENTSSLGYITEKIFDCFLGGCVPIYLGAKNIAQYVPRDTFVDKRNFKTYDELYQYIKNMPDTEYKKYLDALKNSAANGKLYPFSAECFAKTICNGILEDLVKV